MDFKKRREEFRQQQVKVEQQLAQLTRTKHQLEGALAVLDAQIAEDESLPTMKEP